MKHFIGIRFSRYGQVRVGSFENSQNEIFSYGQEVVVQNSNALYFGHVVWQSDHLASLCASHKNDAFETEQVPCDKCKKDNELSNSNVAETNKDVITTPFSKNIVRTKGAFAESFEATQVQSYSFVRLANDEEKRIAENNTILSLEAHKFCKKCVRERELEMKLVDVEVLLDKSKIIFYFTAPTRIDFRELVKDLVREYRTRIELRQIGVRHETQMLGTLGNCGMAVCCRRYLKEFVPVTIKMAKEQNLFLNPAKISGMCGRLLCCLSYEQEGYEAFHKAAPKIGKVYQTDNGLLRVLRTDIFKNAVIIQSQDGKEESIKLDTWHLMNPKRSDSSSNFNNTLQDDFSKNPYEYMDLADEYADEYTAGYPPPMRLSEIMDEAEQDEQAGQDSNVKRNTSKDGLHQENAQQNPRQAFDSSKRKSRHQVRPREKAQKRANFDEKFYNEKVDTEKYT